jgi:hypothetical protein
METGGRGNSDSSSGHGPSFNFLASLINGNLCLLAEGRKPKQSFNFLASLINGNDGED